jgi:hypothetical protein
MLSDESKDLPVNSNPLAWDSVLPVCDQPLKSIRHSRFASLQSVADALS